LQLPQTINPGPVGPFAVGVQQAAISESPLLFECFLDTRRECFLHLWELILAAILFVVLVSRTQLTFPHTSARRRDRRSASRDTVLDKGPIECCPKPTCLILEGVQCWPDLQIPRTATFDRYSQLSIAKCRTIAIPFKNIAHLKMEFDVALQQITALCADPAHDAVFREDNCIFPAS